MKEIEILVEVYDSFDTIKEKFNNYNYISLNRIIDEYYYDPLRNNLKPDSNNSLKECFRIRRKNDKTLITYKDDVFDGDKWLYSNEYETIIESYDMGIEIFNRLGLVKFIEIDNNKYTYEYNNYEIVIEDVKDLGLFLEVEYSTDKDVDVKKIKEDIELFINSLEIKVSKELNMGKPEMYMKKHNVIIE